jgi:MoxR-like ATPase
MKERLQILEQKLNQVLIGKPETVRLCLAAVLARGHVLIEDIPGIGKTTLAQGLARLIELKYQRIQFTSDLLPSDILGVAVYLQSKEQFEFKPGPIFHSIVLADEINRATPRTQSALLEAMQEHQVSVEGTTYALPDPFFVIATQNPIEHYGTYPLPDSQLDRFLLSLRIGYPVGKSEIEVLKTRSYGYNFDQLKPVISGADLLSLQQQVENVRVDDALLEYILKIIQATRERSQVRLGASPRAGLGLKQAAKALAFLQGRDYLIPDDIKKICLSVLRHRLILKQDIFESEKRNLQAELIIAEILDSIPPPI